jgi:hypothetical protein
MKHATKKMKEHVEMKKTTVQEPAGRYPYIHRLNLIFHGLLGFVEKGDRYHVMIPDSPMHEYLAGDPEQPDKKYPLKNLGGLPRGCFELQGVFNCDGESCHPALRHGIVVKGASVKPVNANARTILSIPKPDMIRPYRAVESRFLTDPASGDQTHRVMCNRPDLVHTVVMFSYKHFHLPTWAPMDECTCEFDPDSMPPFLPPLENRGVNYCIYVTLPATEQNDIRKMSFAQAQVHRAHHDAPFNRMFTVTGPLGTVSQLSLSATFIGEQQDGTRLSITDGPPKWLAAGIGALPLHLLNPSELETDFHMVTFGDPSGCSQMFVQEEP